jgi:hypothetical protein
MAARLGRIATSLQGDAAVVSSDSVLAYVGTTNRLARAGRRFYGTVSVVLILGTVAYGMSIPFCCTTIVPAGYVVDPDVPAAYLYDPVGATASLPFTRTKACSCAGFLVGVPAAFVQDGWMYRTGPPTVTTFV